MLFALIVSIVAFIVAGWGLLRSPTHLLVNQAERDTFAEENSPNKLQWLGVRSIVDTYLA